MRRHVLGILALLLLAIAGYGFAQHLLAIAGYGSARDGLSGDGGTSFFLSSCLRVGLVLGAVWLAFPQLLKLTSGVSPAMLTLLGTIAVIVIVRPRTIVVLGPILLLLAILQFFGWLLKPPPGKARRR